MANLIPCTGLNLAPGLGKQIFSLGYDWFIKSLSSSKLGEVAYFMISVLRNLIRSNQSTIIWAKITMFNHFKRQQIFYEFKFDVYRKHTDLVLEVTQPRWVT